MVNYFHNKVIVVTGGCGYIGSSLIRALLGRPKKIIRVSRKAQDFQNDIVDWQLDLSIKDSWLKIVSEADVIFHLSGNTSVYKAEENTQYSYLSTVMPIKLLIESARQLSKKPRVIFASTATVYGLIKKTPVSESFKTMPITTYDSHKLEAENALTIASKKNIINASSLRLSNVYGPSLSEALGSDRGILSRVVKMALLGNSIKIYGDGNFVRDYIFIEDVIEAMIELSIIEAQKEIYNVATGIGSTVKAVFKLIANEIERQTGRKVDIQNIEWPKGSHRIETRNFTASIELIISNTNWRPKTSLENGIKLLIKHYIDERAS